MEDTVIRLAVGAVAAAAVAARSVFRKSVDISALFVGIPVMIIHMVAGYRYGLLLLVFFYSSSKVTRVGEESKRAVDPEFKEGGQRNWKQVLSNSGIATVLVIVLFLVTRGKDMCLDTDDSDIVTGLLGGIIGHYACCNGDTWSSELGILSKAHPRLITSLKRVRKGTNGAITIFGLVAATLAGLVIGVVFVLVGYFTTDCAPHVARKQLLVIPIATASGVCGSLIDSLLGATVQYSGYCTVRKKVVGKEGPTVAKISGRNILNNNGVNAVSILLTTLLTALACHHIF